MSRASMQDTPLWRTLLSSKVALVFVATFFYAFLSYSSAQIEDITPPTLTDFSFTPTTIDTSSGQAVVTVNLSAIDDLSGVTYVEAAFSSPSGQTRSADAILSPALSVSATFDVTFPQFSEVGIWTVNRINLSDALSNPRVILSTELAQLGFPTELVVVGDVTPPMITITATPDALWPPNGRIVPVIISGTITDEDSDADTITATYEVTDEYGSGSLGGDVTIEEDGSYAFTIKLQASRHGNDKDGRQYTITISAQDNEGNQGSNSTIVTVPHDQR